MNWEKGIIGALGGAATGYAAGKVAGIESTQKTNTMLLSHVLDQKMAEFSNELASKRDDVRYNRELARDETNYKRDVELSDKDFERKVAREDLGYNRKLEEEKDRRAWEAQQEEARRRWALSNREPKSPQGEYAYNPNTGEQVWVSKGETPPRGFVVKDFYDDKGPDVDLAKQNFMGKYGVAEDPTGGFMSEPMTAEQKAQAEAEAKQMGLNVYFKKGTDDGGWFGKSKDVYTVSSIAPAMGGRGIISSQAPQGQAPGAGQQVNRKDGNWHKAPDGKAYRWDEKVGKWEAEGGGLPQGKQRLPVVAEKKEQSLPSKEEIGSAAEAPPTNPRNPNEAVYGRQEPGKSLITGAQELMNKTRVDKNNPQFGEGPIESTLRLQGRGGDLHERKTMADRIRERYPDLSDEQIAKILREEM